MQDNIINTTAEVKPIHEEKLTAGEKAGTVAGQAVGMGVALTVDGAVKSYKCISSFIKTKAQEVRAARAKAKEENEIKEKLYQDYLKSKQ